MGLFQFSIQNRAFVNAIMAGVIFLGIYAFINLPKELSSEISFNWAFIVTDYAGAGPEAVEELITIPLEDEIANVRRVDAISSVSSEGRSVISVKFESMPRDEFRDLFRDLQQEVDGLEKLPEGAEKPAVIDYDSYTWQPLVKVMVMGNLAEEKLKDLTEDLEDRLRAIKHVREVNAYGLRDREIWVEVDPKRLAGYQLTLAEVVTSISRQGMDLPGGRIKGARSEYLIQTAGEFAGPEEIKRVVVRTVDNAGLIRVEDLASVRQTMEEPRALARFNGQPAMGLTVIKDGPGNSIALVKQIKEVVADFLAQAPPSVRVELVGDTSRLIWEALSKLVYNAILGAVLVFILLYFTLGLRNALFAAWGIPMVFMATFLFMKQVGESINGTSLFALVLVSGMIVDDAIVILENIYRYMEKGYDVVPAVLAGGREVVWPVVNSSLTTILSFVPLMFMPGIVGNFLKIIPLVVTLALLASLFEALIILPSHVADWGKLSTRKRRPRLFPWLRRRYLPILKIGLRHRWALMTGVLIVAGAFAGLTPLLGVDMFADEELSQFQIRLSTRPGTRLEETGRAAADMEGLVEKLLSRERKYVGTNIGIQHTDREIKRNTHVGELWVDLTPADQRQRSVDEIIAQLRENTQQLSGFNSLEFAKFSSGPPLGMDVDVKLVGRRLTTLKQLAEEIKRELRVMPGLYDVQDDFDWGKERIRVEVDQEKAALAGLSVSDVARAVRDAFEGRLASTIREGDEEIKVVVKFDQKARQEVESIQDMYLTGKNGQLVPFKELARTVVERAPVEVRRFDRNRAISVFARVDDKVITPLEANAKLVERFADISLRYPGYRLDFRGQFDEFKQAFSDLKVLLIIGLVLVYIMLTAQFKSLAQPLIILFAVPLSFMGAVLALIITGKPFSIPVMYGIVALAGIVVNDGLVLVDFINQGRRRGMNRWRSILQGCKIRLRPVLLTTVTTIAGMLPMATGIGGRSEIWMPLANTMVFGLLVASLLTLVVVPALYAMLDDIKAGLARLSGQA